MNDHDPGNPHEHRYIYIYIHIFRKIDRIIWWVQARPGYLGIWVSKIGHDEMAHQWTTYFVPCNLQLPSNRKAQKENGWFQTHRLLMFYPTSADDPT